MKTLMIIYKIEGEIFMKKIKSILLSSVIALGMFFGGIVKDSKLVHVEAKAKTTYVYTASGNRYYHKYKTCKFIKKSKNKKKVKLKTAKKTKYACNCYKYR